MKEEKRSCCAPSANEVAEEAVKKAREVKSAAQAGERDLTWALATDLVKARSSRAITIAAGAFLMGTDDPIAYPQDREGPVREVEVAQFKIDPYLVTNQEFAAFIKDTGYVTDAERFGWSYVFGGFLPASVRKKYAKPAGTPWWRAVAGANWFEPLGPGRQFASELAEHPVVHVSNHDARAFAAWCGMRLPLEAEWEKAARGGLVQNTYAWGNEFMPPDSDGRPKHMANIWQGVFPVNNTQADGYKGTSPVGVFPANGFGLFDVAGNVWEWTASTWHLQPDDSDWFVIRGGSYLCHDSYCHRYRVSARTTSSLYDSSGNMGFRLAVSS